MRGAFQGKQTHSVQVCPNYIALVSILKKCYRHFHIFVSIKRCTQIEVLDIQAHIPRIFCAEDTVPCISLEVVRLAVFVESLPGYLIKLPPAIIQMQ